MNGIDLVGKLAEMQKQYADAHRSARHAHRHPEQNYDGKPHVSQYETRQ
jgi:hypothetical protein